MVSEESLISCFCSLGCEIPDKAIINRCLQLCHSYNMDEETFTELWVAYAVPHSLKNIVPTLEDLNRMEEEELKKNKYVCAVATSIISSIQVDTKTSQEIIDSNNVLDIYTTGESSVLKQNKRIRSPTAEQENDNKIRAVDQAFTPSTYTATVNTPNRALSATVRGKILLHFGLDIKSWRKKNEQDVSIVKADNPHVPKDVVYMYEMLSKQGAVLSSNCESFGERLCHVWNEMEPTNSNMRYVRNVTSISQTPFRTWGRISTMFDKSIRHKTVMLEGCKRSKGFNNAPVVSLDLSKIKHYSVFPGQVLAVEGINTAGNALLVKDLFLKGHALLADVPKLSRDLRIYVAVGPFTPPDSLNYQPLWDLMECVVEEEPDILILVGPFVEYTHSEVKKCTLRDTYQEFFDKILAKIVQCLQGKNIHIVLVSSNRDVHHDAVYPTPEYSINTNKFGSNLANVHSMPDPCIISVEGLQIGITSVDVLRHLGQQEVSNISGMDRVGRLADHVLSQATFYPLYPPFCGLNLDTTLWKNYACFERQPHIMILPSDIKYYCKPINESLILNPERLQKYIYAKLYIRPVSNGKWNPNNVSCEIAKV